MSSPEKSLDERRRAVSQAIARAYTVSVYPGEIGTEFANQDVREFVRKTAGRPHADVTVERLAALALSRAGKQSGDDALASTLADLIDGGVSLDRQAAAARGLTDSMARHRAKRARENPLPSDLKVKARAAAPSVIRRSGQSAVRPPAPPPPPAQVVKVGCRVRYLRLDDETEHEVVVGTQAAPGPVRAVPTGSPLARGLLGATKGTIVQVVLGGAQVEIEVLDVHAPGE